MIEKVSPELRAKIKKEVRREVIEELAKRIEKRLSENNEGCERIKRNRRGPEAQSPTFSKRERKGNSFLFSGGSVRENSVKREEATPK